MRRVLAIIMIVALALCGCGNQKKSSTNTIFEVTDEEWNKIDTKYCEFENKQEFIEQLERYAEDIVETLDWEEKYKENFRGSEYTIHVFFSDEASNSSFLGTKINYNKDLVSHGVAPLPHEIVHVLIGDSGSYSLNEGLAHYFQDKIGTPSVFINGLNPHGLMAFSMKNLDCDKIIRNMGTDRELSFKAEEVDERRPYQYASDSFVTYLIETYGIESFMQIYVADNKNEIYEKTIGKTLETVQDEWVDFVLKQKEQYTQEYIDEYLEKFYAEHGIE